MWVWFLIQEDPLEKETANLPQYFCLEISWTEGPAGPQSLGCKESDTTEWLSTCTHTHTHTHTHLSIYPPTYLCICVFYIQCKYLLLHLFFQRNVINATSLSQKRAVRLESVHNNEQGVSDLQPKSPRDTYWGSTYTMGSMEHLCKRVSEPIVEFGLWWWLRRIRESSGLHKKVRQFYDFLNKYLLSGEGRLEQG